MRTLIFLISLLLIGLVVTGCEKDSIISDPTPAADDPNTEAFLVKKFTMGDHGVVKVMTRNVYVGTDFEMILGAEDQKLVPFYVAQAFELLQNTNFYERAQSLAREVKWVRPHLIGLQEISTIRYQSPGDFLIGNPKEAKKVLYDYLKIYTSALKDHGLYYKIAVVGQNIDIELPMVTDVDENGYPIAFDDVRLTDYDVILVRKDIKFTNPIAKRYAQELPVSDLISVPSGYVAVTATIGDRSYRFVNTHLDAGPVEDIRLAQAYELLTDLAEESLPIIMLGDFNTPAADNSTYDFIVGQGYHDAWLEKRWGDWQDGDTFGHDADLRNPVANFYERIDFVFYLNFNPVVGPVIILGDEYFNRTVNGLWPSDHAGVAALLRN
jgi:endonuclease/exonuclease/phosphatase family metal-dependent hydrolase